MQGFAVGRANQALYAPPPCPRLAEAPTSFETTLLYLEPYAWPAAILVLALAIIVAAVIVRSRRTLPAGSVR